MIAPADPPTLHTRRLTLAAHTAADYEESAALWADADVVRFIGGKPSTPPEAWARLLRYGGLWRLLGYGYWVVRDTASGRFVGEVGFGDFHRDIDPSLNGVPEAGWAVSPACHGQGFGSEAVRAALDWIDVQEVARTVCIISPSNEPSLALARRMGFRPFARTLYTGNEVIVLERNVGEAARGD